jgi:hypothetical protein
VGVTTVSKPKAVPLDHLRGRKKPVTRSVDIFLDSAVADAIREADRTFEEADRTAMRRPDDLEAQVARDQALAVLEGLRRDAVDDEQVVTFRFASIGRKAFDRLRDEHPPTEEQQRRAREDALAAGLRPDQARVTWNDETFPPALISAAAIEPKITLEEADEICNRSPDWNDAEVGALFLAALQAQQQRDVVDLGKASSGSGPTRS